MTEEKTVGQHVVDILEKPYEEVLVEDIVEEFKDEFQKGFDAAVQNGIEQGFTYPFYIYIMQHKEFWADNIVRNWYIARQTPPYALDMIEKYPHHNKILYMVNPHNNRIKICWNIPGYEDLKSILKNPENLSSELISWCKNAVSGLYEKDSYDFDEV